MNFEGLEKECPICERINPPHEGQVLPSGDILYRYKCSRCSWAYVRRDKAPNVTVEVWNNHGRPRL